MNKFILTKILKTFGIDTKRLIQRFSKLSIKLALAENGFVDLVENLRRVEPDISKQYSYQKEFNDYWELKIRAMYAFQCSLMLKALEFFSPGKLTVADIGDSVGTHMRYLSALAKDRFYIDAISVNLDAVAVEKIKARGQEALLCRAEELNLEDKQIDLFTSFEMVEHLHNPAIFFHRLVKKSKCNKMVVTVPYMKKSRVGLYHIRNRSVEASFAEEEHIFELSPKDWTLLILHSGWKIAESKIYYQYPKKLPLISQILALYWRKTDFEGFWGAILEKDTTFSDHYQDWED